MKIDKSLDGVLGTQTRGDRMEGSDASTESKMHILQSSTNRTSAEEKEEFGK